MVVDRGRIRESSWSVSLQTVAEASRLLPGESPGLRDSESIARVPAVDRTSRSINGGLWPNPLLLRAFNPSCENLLDSAVATEELSHEGTEPLSFWIGGRSLAVASVIGRWCSAIDDQSAHPYCLVGLDDLQYLMFSHD